MRDFQKTIIKIQFRDITDKYFSLSIDREKHGYTCRSPRNEILSKFETIDECISYMEQEYGEGWIGPIYSLVADDFFIEKKIYRKEEAYVVTAFGRQEKNKAFKIFDEAYEYVLKLYREQEDD